LTTQIATGTSFSTSNISTNTSYYVTETNAAGCTSTSATTVIATILPKPTVQFGPITSVCQSTPPFVLNEGSQVTSLPGTGNYSGIGVTDSLFTPQTVGTFPIVYTFTATNGCFDTAIQNVSVYAAPVVSYGGTQAVLEGDSITLTPITVSENDLRYFWTPAIYLNNDTIESPISKPADTVTYTISITSPGGCQSSAVLFVQVLSDFVVPNTFTPNHDGINDTWDIPQLPKYPIQWVQVFDRYGQLLYESHGYSTPGWDGTYKGHDLPAGTYYYVIELNGFISPKTGYVTILR
jgi:gliding motility-associated-like protein